MRKLAIGGLALVAVVLGAVFLVSRPGKGVSFEYQSLVENDKTGRSAVVKDGRVRHHQFSGVFYDSRDNQKIEKMMGEFAGWEGVEGSQDRIMRLKDAESGELLPEVRVVFEQGGLTAYTTMYRVIDLNKIGNDDYYASIATGRALAELASNQLAKIIRAGDVVEAESNYQGGAPLVDSEGRMVARFVNLRRFGGVSSLEAELK